MERFKKAMNETFTIRGSELALGLACCTLLGVVVSMLLLPPKDITIGCNNHIVEGKPDDEEEAEEADGE